jgi:hypothetical protein
MLIRATVEVINDCIKQGRTLLEFDHAVLQVIYNSECPKPILIKH